MNTTTVMHDAQVINVGIQYQMIITLTVKTILMLIADAPPEIKILL